MAVPRDWRTLSTAATSHARWCYHQARRMAARDGLSGFHVDRGPLPVAFGAGGAELQALVGPVMAEAGDPARHRPARHGPQQRGLHSLRDRAFSSPMPTGMRCLRPAFRRCPIGTLLSKLRRLAGRGSIANPRHAEPSLPNAGASPSAALWTDKDPGQLDTSYICTVDRWGNAFSATPSDASAGAPVISSLGFVPSTRGTQSFTDPASPGRGAPARAAAADAMPGLRAAGGDGSYRSAPATTYGAALSRLPNTMVFGRPQEAVEAPRFATFSYPRSSASDPSLKLEGRISETLRSLREWAMMHVPGPTGRLWRAACAPSSGTNGAG